MPFIRPNGILMTSLISTSPTNPQNFTSNFTVKGPSGGYGLPQGTGYVRVDMVFPALNPSNFPGTFTFS